MPLYDYKCKQCEHTFKRNLRIANRKEPEAEPCPSCEATESVTQQLGGLAIVSGVVGAGSLKKPQWFQDKIKDMKKVVGKGHTLDNM